MQLKLLLEEEGYGIIQASNGEKGLEAARNFRPSLIISDIVMPVMDGYEMCRLVKEAEDLKQIPVLLLTSLSDPADVIKGLNSKADNYLTKPYDESFLLERVKDILAHPNTDEEKIEPHLDITFLGQPCTIRSNRRQILNLLLSTYQNAIQRNNELIKAKEELEHLNEKLGNNLHQLRSSEERFKSLVMTIPDIVYRIDPNGCFIFVNEAVRRLGYAPEELVGEHFSKVILPIDLNQIARSMVLPKYQGKRTGNSASPDLFDERRSGERMTTGLEIRLRPKHGIRTEPGFVEPLGGEVIIVEINSSGMYEINPNTNTKTFMGTVGVIRDISVRKQMEEALKESEERLKTILDYAEAGIIVVDSETRCIVEANRAALSMIGADRKEVIGSICHQYICPSENNNCPVLDLGQNIDSTERKLLAKKNKEIPILKTAAPIQLEGRPHLLESFVDISKLKATEEELIIAKENLEIEVEERTAALKDSHAKLIQTEKVAALGVLTAGIAHELNNPMMGILNFSQYCLKHTDADDRRYPVLVDTIREVSRCSDIVRNLLTFTRTEHPEEEEFEQESIVAILDRVFRLLSYRTEKDNIRITRNIDMDIPLIWMKKTGIQQVFINLIGNALDALKRSEEKKLHIRIKPMEKMVETKVIDTGEGIGSGSIMKIFDPFYTTKPPGMGTGLGLSVSRGIVESHGGFITCESRKGEGAVFRVLLPIDRTEEPAMITSDNRKMQKAGQLDAYSPH